MNDQVLNEIISECKRFAQKEIRGQALEADLDPAKAPVSAVWRKSAALDLPSLLFPEAVGGAGMDELCVALVLDILAGECAGMASVFAHHYAACVLLNRWDNAGLNSLDKQIARIQGPDAKPAAIVCPPPLEEGALLLEENGEDLILNGTTQPIANTAYAGLYCIIVEEATRPGCFTGLILTRERMSRIIGEESDLPGLRINPFRPLCFQRFRVLRKEMIGERGNAGRFLQDAVGACHAFTAATAMGSARTAFQKAYAYAGRRYQYGDTIIHHQEIQRMLGAMQMKLSVGTTAYTRLFSKNRLKLPASAQDPRLVKAYCTDAALEIIIDAIQIHGGYGYMHEYGLEKRMRDGKVLQLLGGSNPHHMVQVIAETV